MQKLILILPFLLVGCSTAPDFLRRSEIVARERQEAAEKAAYQAAAQDFNATCALYLTADEEKEAEERTYVAQLYKGDISWQGLINSFTSYMEELTQNKATVKDPTKDNKALGFLLYNDIHTRTKNINDFLYTNQKFREETCYKDLQALQKKLENIEGQIESFFYRIEKAEFHKRSGLYISSDPRYPLALIAGITSQQPDPKTIYRFGGVKVLQVLEDGILISSIDGGLAYIQMVTDRPVVDNLTLYDLYVLPNGTKKYHNVLGAQRTVYAFKEVDMPALYKKYATNALFFPEIKSKEDLPDIQQMMLSLLTKK